MRLFSPVLLLLGGLAATALPCRAQGIADLAVWPGNGAWGGNGTQLLGQALATGDFNGDGLWDLALSAPGAAANAGEVYLFFGPLAVSADAAFADPAASAQLIVRGEEGAQIGRSLELADVNGDGLEDLLIGAPLSGGGRGELWILFGDEALSGLRSSPDVVLLGAAPGDQFGAAVGATLYNGDDTIQDLVIGSPLADPLGRDAAGRVDILIGRQTGWPDTLDLALQPPEVTLFGGEPGGRFGAAVSRAVSFQGTLLGNDLNGDGAGDLIAAAPDQVYRGRTGAGAVHLFYTHESLIDTVDLAQGGALDGYKIIGGAQTQDRTGAGLASAHLTGSRRLLIGAPNARHDNLRTGAAYEISWSELNALGFDVDLLQAGRYRVKLLGASPGDSLGAAVAALGSLRLVSAPGRAYGSRTHAGEVYGFTAGNTLLGVAVLDTLTAGLRAHAGASSGDLIGRALALGDLDDDGLVDFIFASPAAFGFAGAAHLVRGGLPAAYDFNPGPGSSGIATNDTLRFSAVDDEEGIDPDGLALELDGIDYTAADPEVSLSEQDGVYSFAVLPAQPFALDVPIPVEATITDLAGNRSPRYAFTFITGRDNVAPRVTQRSPDAGETGVATTRAVEFNLEDDGVGVDSSSLRLTVEGTLLLPGAPGLSITGTPASYRVAYQPVEPFPTEARIDIRIEAGDLAEPAANVMTPDEYYFFTAVDSDPPRIVEILPAPGGTIDVAGEIRIRLADDGAGVDPEATSLTLTQDGTPSDVELVFEPLADGFWAVHRPTAELYQPGGLEASLASADRADPPNPRADSVWTYTVIEDTDPPQLVSASPAPGSADAPRTAAILLVVNDNAAGVDSAGVLLEIDGAAIAHDQIEWTRNGYAGYTLDYEKTDGLYGPAVGVRLRAPDRALTPNVLDTTYTFTTVQDGEAPVVVYMDPSPGEAGVSIRDSLIWEVTDDLSGVDEASVFAAVDGADMTGLLQRENPVNVPSAEVRFVLAPPQPFQYESEVNVFFSIADREQPANEQPLEYSFTTEPDEEPPFLANLSPFPGQTGVSRGADIVFHVLDDGLGVERDSVHLFLGGAHVPDGDLFLEAVDRGYAVRYNPPGLFGHEDTVRVEIWAHDRAGTPNFLREEYYFVTLSDDREPPVIANLQPADSAVGWPVGGGIEFDLLDDGEGVDTSATVVQNVDDPLWTAAATVTPVENGFHYSLAPTLPWTYSDTVHVAIRSRDLADPPNETPDPFAFVFFVERDDDAPSAADLFPGPDSGMTANRRLEFRLLDPLAGVDSSSVRLEIDGVEVTDSALVDPVPEGLRYRYRPAGGWTTGDTLSAVLSARDLSAGRNAMSFAWSFHIVPDTLAPYLPPDSLSPAPGASNVSFEDTLTVTVLDDGLGVDPGRLDLTLAGRPFGDFAQPDTLERGMRFRLPLANAGLFAGQQVEVRLEALDLAVPPNRTSLRWSFRMEPPGESFSIVPTTITPNGDGVWDEAVIYHDGGPGAEVSIFDLRGRRVARLGGSPVRWDGRDDRGRDVPGGLYIVQVKADGKVRQGTLAVAR